MSRLALCLVLSEIGGGPDIDNSLPGGGYGPIDPGFGVGWGGGRPDNSLPGAPGRPDNSLPGRPPHVGGRPPGQGVTLPSHPIFRPPAGTKPLPPGVSPGAGLWVVAYVPGKGFNWVSVSPGVPEKPQPTPPGGTVDNTLPSVPVDPAAPTTPDNTLPPTATPKA